jgi:signal transduction histidine kinase
LRVSVRDTGIGIRAQDQERVFKEFEQVDSSYGREQQGTGLGLALTKKLVEMHDGQVWVESAGVEGKGSAFTFLIPIRRPKVDEALAPGAIL